MNKQENEINILKGICITLMVLGHTLFFGENFIYLFHMALFIMSAGYCFNEKYADSLVDIVTLVKKRLISLWVPYCAFNIIFLLFNNIFIRLNLLTCNPQFSQYVEKYNLRGGYSLYFSIKDSAKILFKILLFGYEMPFGGVGWFLRVLFAITIMYGFNLFLLKKITAKSNIYNLIISIFLLLIGYAMRENGLNFENIGTICSCYILFNIGFLMKKVKEKHIVYNWVSIALSLLILLVCQRYTTVNLVNNDYLNPFVLVALSILGWIMIYGISEKINKVAFKEIFICIGKNTISIMFLHLICFKIITYLQLKYYNLPDFLMASQPVLFNKGVWWVAYGIVGVSVPLVIAGVYKYVVGKVITK